MHDDRQRYIKNNISEAEKMHQEAYLDREKANDEIIQARLQATEIIAAARIEAQDLHSSKIILANKEVEKIKEDAKRDIEAQQTKFEIEAKEAIVEVALAAAAKVVEHEVDSTANRKIINDFIKASK